MSARQEFPRHVKRAAWERAKDHCEASGILYGLPKEQRCNMPLNRGVDYDHVTPDGLGGEPTLENCLAVCRRCHDIKTNSGDIPRIAKMKRQRDKVRGISGPKRDWPKRRMNERYVPRARQLHEDVS